MADARAAIVISAQDQASKEIANLNSHIAGLAKNIQQAGGSAAGSISSFGSFGGALGNIAQIASGILSAAMFERLAGGMVELGKSAFDATAQYERQKIGIESLVAREIVRNSVVEKSIVVGQQRVETVNKEAKNIGALNAKISDEIFKRQQIVDKINIENMALGKLYAAKKQDAIAIARKIEQIENLKQSHKDINELIDKNTAAVKNASTSNVAYVDIIKKVTTGQMSMTDALAKAAPRAAELLSWIRQLAIHSPFDKQGITDAFNTALAYGFVSDEAQKLTVTLVDWAAASGKQTSSIKLASYALGQIRSSSKLYTQDLRQLMDAGIDVNFILKKMGSSLEKVGKESVSSQDFLKNLTEMLNNDFGGAADRMTNSFDGLRSTLMEIQPDLLRAFATPILDKFRESFSKIVGLLTSDKILVTLEGWGKAVTEKVAPAFNTLASFFTGDKFDVEKVKKAFLDMFPKNTQTDIKTFFETIKTGFDNLKKFWDENGAKITGGVTSIALSLTTLATSQVAGAFKGATEWLVQNGGVISETITTIARFVRTDLVPGLQSLSKWVSENKPTVLAFFAGLAAAEITMGIAALSGTIAALLTPLGLLAATIGVATFVAIRWGDEIRKFLVFAGMPLIQFADDFAAALLKTKNPIDSFIKDLTTIYRLINLISGAEYFRQIGGMIRAGNLPNPTVRGNNLPDPAVRAMGGSVSANTPYIVGEKGAEMFIPNRSGLIVPNNKLSGGGSSSSSSIVINVNGTNDPYTTAQMVIRELRDRDLLPVG